ncbi:queuosine precursor transporter [Dongshaea marina]|uniref:queuosine precursor transporter n=1 Tax=Dongshaea marina TaxID=2047966 RepID=UPI000D3EE0BE|nr:queuosine precursor transporter [Dongshaea marina]
MLEIISIKNGIVRCKTQSGREVSYRDVDVVNSGDMISYFNEADIERITRSSKQTGLVLRKANGKAVSCYQSDNVQLLSGLSIAFSFFSLISVLVSSMTSITLFGIHFPAGIFIYPIGLMLLDVINESFGAEHSRKTIYISTGIILGAAIVIAWLVSMPREYMSDYQVIQEVFSKSVGYLLVFSIAFLISNYLNALVFTKLKSLFLGRFLWLRCVLAALACQLIISLSITVHHWLDHGITYRFLLIVSTMYLLKIALVALFSPCTYLFVWYSKAKFRQGNPIPS